ncbi:hypothetical protein ACHQM5_012693 [Ranunculus cassubicifolius]
MARKRGFQSKKKLAHPKKEVAPIVVFPCSPTKLVKIEEVEVIEESINDCEVLMSSNCSTPNAKGNRIPKIVSCPPAPKKQRVSSLCSSLRSPIPFFAVPDVELFLNFNRHVVS